MNITSSRCGNVAPAVTLTHPPFACLPCPQDHCGQQGPCSFTGRDRGHIWPRDFLIRFLFARICSTREIRTSYCDATGLARPHPCPGGLLNCVNCVPSVSISKSLSTSVYLANCSQEAGGGDGRRGGVVWDAHARRIAWRGFLRHMNARVGECLAEVVLSGMIDIMDAAWSSFMDHLRPDNSGQEGGPPSSTPGEGREKPRAMSKLARVIRIRPQPLAIPRPRKLLPSPYPGSVFSPNSA